MARATTRGRPPPDGTHVRLGADDLFVRSWGPAEAPPVLLVHGLGITGASMGRLAHLLAPRHRVLAPDMPGHGRSPGGPRPFEAHGDALAALAASLPGPPPLAVAVSLGCNWVAEALARHPGTFAGAVLLAPPCDRAHASGLRQFARWLSDLPAEPAWLAPELARGAAAAGPRVLWDAFQRMLGHPMADLLAGAADPVLVVRGARDRIVPRAWARELAARAGASLAEIPGRGHALHANAPRQVARIVLDVAAHWQGASPANGEPTGQP